MDMSQAFDRVWHGELLHRISQSQSVQHVNILSSYLRDRSFQVHYGEATSAWKPIGELGIPGKCSWFSMYLLYTADVPSLAKITIARFSSALWRSYFSMEANRGWGTLGKCPWPSSVPPAHSGRFKFSQYYNCHICKRYCNLLKSSEL